MTPDRLDDLLARTLETGTIPAEASSQERAELEQLLAARAELLTAREAVDREARAAMPVARARFQRYLAASQPPPVEVRAVAARPTFFERLLVGRRLPLAASLAALLVVALAALLVTGPFRGAQPAQALGVDDYVQLAGTVASSDGATVVVDHPDLGPVRVDATDSVFIDADGNPLASPPAPGAYVIVAGIVREARSDRVVIAAQSLAAAAPPGDEGNGRFERLRSLVGTPEGTLRLVAIDPAGRSGRAIVSLSDGRRVLVDVDSASLGALLASTGSPLGSRVRLADGDGRPFSLERLEDHPAKGDGDGDGPGRAMSRLSGVITDVRPTTFTLQTANGPVTVERRPGLRILPGTGGLNGQELRRLESLEGHTAVVAGFRGRDGEFHAELVVPVSPP
jgi:hypothetical protein